MRNLFCVYVYILCAAILITVVGCETESATKRVTITPDSVALAIGQRQPFTASGGYEYTWSLETENWGALSTRSGSQTIYTSLHAATGTLVDVQILTVTSTIPGIYSTNAVLSEWTAEAYIKHVP